MSNSEYDIKQITLGVIFNSRHIQVQCESRLSQDSFFLNCSEVVFAILLIIHDMLMYFRQIYPGGVKTGEEYCGINITVLIGWLVE